MCDCCVHWFTGAGVHVFPIASICSFVFLRVYLCVSSPIAKMVINTCAYLLNTSHFLAHSLPGAWVHIALPGAWVTLYKEGHSGTCVHRKYIHNPFDLLLLSQKKASQPCTYPALSWAAPCFQQPLNLMRRSSDVSFWIL